MVYAWLFRRIDNVQLQVFRVFFGILITLECWGALLTGWVTETFVTPRFTFTFMGFEWTHFLLGRPMYGIFFVLGLLGWAIAYGWRYRLCMGLFCVGWSLLYFMQKENYNNHYYLLMLVSWFMLFMPAAGQAKDMPNWNRLLFIGQLFIVYTFAAIAKIYPGWYSGQYLHLRFSQAATWFRGHVGWNGFAGLLERESFSQSLSYLGIGFDLLIIPLMLWRPTRGGAFCAALLFHLFNSVTLQIGIFPYFALAMSIFCFPPEIIRKWLWPKRRPFLAARTATGPAGRQKWGAAILLIYILWQIYLPLRHWLIPGDVLWTEEGHRLSWRMMLRSKSGFITFFVLDRSTGKREMVQLSRYLSAGQRKAVSTAPDMMWQFAQILKKKYAEKDLDVSVYAQGSVSVNGTPYQRFVDPDADLAAVKWNYFGHQPWIAVPKSVFRMKPPSFNRNPIK